MSNPEGANKSENAENAKGKAKEIMEDDLVSDPPEPNSLSEGSMQSVDSEDKHRVPRLSLDPIASTSSAKSSSFEAPPSSYSSVLPNVPAVEPPNSVKEPVIVLPSSPDNGNITESESTALDAVPGLVRVQEREPSQAQFQTPRAQEVQSSNPHEIHPRNVNSPDEVDTAFVNQPPIYRTSQTKNEIQEQYEEKSSKATSPKDSLQISNNENQSSRSGSNQSSSPVPSISQYETPVPAHYNRILGLSPITPYTNIDDVSSFSSPRPKFLQEVPGTNDHWKSDGGPTGMQERAPGTANSSAHCLGGPPPVVSKPDNAEIEARKRFVASKVNETATGTRPVTEDADELLQLRAKVTALKNTEMQKMPEEINRWKTGTDTYSREDAEIMTVEDVISIGNDAIESAIQLGNVQTSEIITLHHENSELKKEISLLRKDVGATTDYPTPVEFEEMKVRWEEEIKDNITKLETVECELEIAKSVASLSDHYRKEVDIERERNKSLMIELTAGKIERDKFEGQKSACEDEIATLRNARNDAESNNGTAKGMENQITRNKAQPENGERMLRRKVVRLEKEAKVRSESMETLLARLAKLEPIATIPNQSSASTSSGPQENSDTADADRSKEADNETDAVDLAIMRIKLRLNNLARDRDRCGYQPGDAAGVAGIAWDALSICKKLDDESAFIRVSFWLGIALCYNDDINEARTYFEKADVLGVLPEYEATFLGGWLQLCKAPGEGSKGNKASPSQAE